MATDKSQDIINDYQRMAEEFNNKLYSIDDIDKMPLSKELLSISKQLSSLADLFKQRKQGLISLGVEGGKLENACSILEDKIPNNISLFLAIIDYAIKLKKQEQYKDLTLQEIANTIGKNFFLFDSPYKDGLQALFDKYKIRPRLEGASIQNISVPNNKLANKITTLGLEWYNILFQIDVTPKNYHKEQIKTDVILSFDSPDIKYSKGVTEYDKQIYNIVTSIYLELKKQGKNNIAFSDGMIFKVLAGQEHGSSKPSKETLRTIRQSIEKMSCIRVSINAAQEMGLYGKDKLTISENLLMTKGVKMITPNKDIMAWQLMSEPALYRYAKLCGHGEKGQIQTYPTFYRQVPELSHTPLIDSLIGFLLNRIQNIIHPQNQITNKILLDKIYEHIGISPDNRMATSRARDSILKCLDYWQGKELFKSYALEHKGKKIYAIVIIK